MQNSVKLIIVLLSLIFLSISAMFTFTCVKEKISWEGWASSFLAWSGLLIVALFRLC